MQTSPSRILVRASLAIFCLLPPVRPSSTVLVVSVADSKNGAPLEGALVRLPEIGREARANWIGEARFVNLTEGKYQVQVRHLGYAGSEVSLAVKGDTVGAVFMLEKIVANLDTVRVEAVARSTGFASPVRAEEFDTRRRMGIGHFLTDSVLAAEGSHDLSFILTTRLPALRVELATKAIPNSWMVVGMGVTPIPPKNSKEPDSMATGLCPVDVYIDGLFVPPQDEVSPLRDLLARDLAGIELYNIGEAPAAYRRQGKACKVLMIWRKFR
jgi:hypothetical protein